MMSIELKAREIRAIVAAPIEVVLALNDVEVGTRFWVREPWRSWPDRELTYVAYRATPRVGFRPVPDRSTIIYLDESSAIEPVRDMHLLGPWESTDAMPEAFSRIIMEVFAPGYMRAIKVAGWFVPRAKGGA